MSDHGPSHSSETAVVPSGQSCTVIICTKNRPRELENCILALREQSITGFRVLVVENNDKATEAEPIASLLDADYLLCTRIGLSFARNAGLQACRTEFAAYIDDDAIPDRCWLEELLREFSGPEVMAVTGRCVYEPSGAAPSNEPRRWYVNRSTPDWFAMANFGGIGDGGSMVFRRAALEVWPGFDERLGRGAILCDSEEHHAFFALIDRGFAVVHTPAAIIRHPAAAQDRKAATLPGSEVQKPLSAIAMLRPVAMSTAYMTLLMCEHSAYAGRVVRFIWEAWQRSPRAWGKRGEKVFSSSSPRWQVYLALLAGPLLYCYMRLRHLFAGRATSACLEYPPSVSCEQVRMYPPEAVSCAVLVRASEQEQVGSSCMTEPLGADQMHPRDQRHG